MFFGVYLEGCVFYWFDFGFWEGCICDEYGWGCGECGFFWCVGWRFFWWFFEIYIVNVCYLFNFFIGGNSVGCYLCWVVFVLSLCCDEIVREFWNEERLVKGEDFLEWFEWICRDSYVFGWVYEIFGCVLCFVVWIEEDVVVFEDDFCLDWIDEYWF